MEIAQFMKRLKRSLKQNLQEKNYFDSFYYWCILKKVFHVKKKYIPLEFQQYIADHNECIICLDSPKHGIVFLQCKHMFCAECIYEWFGKGKFICPSCQEYSYYYDECDREFFHRNMDW